MTLASSDVALTTKIGHNSAFRKGTNRRLPVLQSMLRVL
jgi:hypothetical protein